MTVYGTSHVLLHLLYTVEKDLPNISESFGRKLNKVARRVRKAVPI